MATHYEKKLLHMAKAYLRLDDDAYRDLLESWTGQRSSMDLDHGGVQAAMEGFRLMGWEPWGGYNARRRNGFTRNCRPRRHDPGEMPSGAMLAKIQHMYADLGTPMPKQQEFNRRQCGKPWPQTIQDASKVMEGLKAILGRKKRDERRERQAQPA